jgi:hypothetical protein
VCEEDAPPRKKAPPGCQSASRQAAGAGYRNGSAAGTRKTAAGGLRVQVPQGRGRAEPSRSQRWANLATTRAPLTPRRVAMLVGGRSRRAVAAALEQVRGPCVLSHSSIRPLTDPRRQASEAVRPRAHRGAAVASLLLETVYAP